MTTRWQRIALRTMGEGYAERYAARFREQAAAGSDTHGEAAFVDGLVDRAGWPTARILDAGCGTGRVGVRLAELGHAVVGVDADPAMVEQARREAPDLDWRVADLSAMDLGQRFEVVVLAGNIVPLLEEGTLGAVADRLAAHTVTGGLAVCGFGLDADHLPAGCPPVPLTDVEEAMTSAGLELTDRLGGWDGGPYVVGGGYVVTVHRLGGEAAG